MAIEAMLKRLVTNHYGPRSTEGRYGGKSLDVTGKKQVARWIFNYNNLPDAATHGLDVIIPANSTIVSAKLNIITAFTSTSTTTTLTVGLQKASGAGIDDDGLITAAQATKTTIAVANSIIDGASGTPGALIGFTIGTSDGELVVTPSANDLLTGRAEVIVEYLLPAPSQQSISA